MKDNRRWNQEPSGPEKHTFSKELIGVGTQLH